MYAVSVSDFLLHVPATSIDDIFVLYHINHANTTRLYTVTGVSFPFFYYINILYYINLST